MGVLFQRSCFQVQDATYKALAPDAITDEAKEQLEERGRRKFDRLLTEARTWMYAILVPNDIIANGNKDIQKELDSQIEKLTIQLLGHKIDHNKVVAVCGKLARNILIPGIANVELGSKYYPDHPRPPPAAMMTNLLDDRHVRAGFYEIILNECQGFWANYPRARTWREIREATLANNYTIASGEPLLPLLNSWQELMTNAELGIPYAQKWREETEQAIYARMQSADPMRLSDFEQSERDLILVRAGGKDIPADACAEMNCKNNVITLGTCGFYERPFPDSIRGVNMEEGKGSLHDISTGVTALLHEITHSKDVLYTEDHTFIYNWSLNSDEKIMSMHLYPTSNPVIYAAYGVESCLALVRRDKDDDYNKAEDNADSWALYFTLRVLLLAYPELDIVGALEGADPRRVFVRILRYRQTLLHHCTLFQALRNPKCDDFPKRTLDYKESKDWCKQERNWTYDAPPREVEDLLKVLKIILH